MTKPKTGVRESRYVSRAVAWLETQPPGTEATLKQVAHALGHTDPRTIQSMRSCLLTGARDGLLMYRPGPSLCGRRKSAAYWSLPDLAIEQSDPLPRRTFFPEIQPRPGMLFPGVYASAGEGV